MKVLVTGASGLIGSALVPSLSADGHETVLLSRTPGNGRVVWDPLKGEFDASRIEGVEAVVHLAGADIAAGRWTVARKTEIRDSRVKSTRLLVDRFEQMVRPPRLLLCSSAVGIYGDTGETMVAEDGPAGSGFLSDVCREWEAEAGRANELGMCVVQMRTGVVLSPDGGALAKLLPVFRSGLGGPVGGGKQWMSWITIDDMVAAIGFLLNGDTVSGPVNVVSPTPVTNAEFARVLGHVLNRPTLAPVPGAMLKLIYGEMAVETILASARVVPGRLIEAGFQFEFPEVEVALRHLLEG